MRPIGDAAPDPSTFARDGYARLPGFVGEAELAALREEVQRVLAAPLPPGCERPHNTLAPLRWDDDIVARVLSSPERRAALRRATGGRDLRWISAYVSVKDPHSPPLWWHQDWWCWDHPVSYRRAASQVAVLCYLDDAAAENAALRVLPGTHHRSVSLHAALPEAHAREAGELDEDDVALSDRAEQVTLDVRAGDAVVIDYRLLHGTHANAGGERRLCLVVTFAPAWSDLPGDIRAHLIRHPALPGAAERPAGDAWAAELLPTYDGVPRDLELNRVAPAEFEALA